MWSSVLERFEQHAPASVMARVALEHALPREWIDTVFEEHRQRHEDRPSREARQPHGRGFCLAYQALAQVQQAC